MVTLPSFRRSGPLRTGDLGQRYAKAGIVFLEDDGYVPALGHQMADGTIGRGERGRDVGKRTTVFGKVAAHRLQPAVDGIEQAARRDDREPEGEASGQGHR